MKYSSVVGPDSPDTRIAGSFRDPSGYVFSRHGGMFRAIDAPCHDTLRALADAGLLSALIRDRVIVDSTFVDDPELRRHLATEHSDFEHFLQHEVLSTITYPYEWSVSMLADAGVRTLDLQMRLLSSGFSLKDATAYNIQFVQHTPKFIDISSIERPQRMDLWFALGQFMQMFTFPLLLCRYYGWDLRSYFLANLGGRSAEELLRGFGWLHRLQPRLLLSVTLPALLTGWTNKPGQRQPGIPPKRDSDPKAQLMILKRLRARIVRLARSYKTKGTWSEYTRVCSYDAAAEKAKKDLVRRFLESTRPGDVLDLGCNTGDYSRLSAACGANVIAVDSDHDAVELLYRSLRTDAAPITPMVLDLCNPSPGVGFMNRERSSFFQRFTPDCVLALALIHHLVVAGNLPLPALCDMLADLTSRDLVLEFVPTDDSMFQQLLRFRVDLFGDFTLKACRDVFARRFEILNEKPINGCKRTLLFLRKR